MGLDVSTERNRGRWRCSVVVRACREEGTARNKARKKNKNTANDTPQHQRRMSGTKRAGGGGSARSRKGKRGAAGGPGKKTKS